LTSGRSAGPGRASIPRTIHPAGLILTFFLVWVTFRHGSRPARHLPLDRGACDRRHDHARHLHRRPLHGRRDDPARSFGPQLVHNTWANGWVWYLGPALGAVLAALAYEWLYLRPLAPEPVGPPETGVEEPAPGRAATE
jgi:Major intrinsic protein